MLFSLGHSSFSCSQKAVQRNRGARDVDIPNMIGDTHATVRRLYRGLMVLQQAENQNLYNIEDRTNSRLFFSHLYTGLGYPGIQTFLGITEKTSYTPTPVKSKYRNNLGYLCVWLFECERNLVGN